MRTRKNVNIDGVDYDVGPVKPSKALKLMTKITKVLGPTLAGLLKDGSKLKSGGKESILDSDIDLSVVFNEFFDRLKEDEVQGIMLTLIGETLHQGREGEKGFGVITNIQEFDVAFADEGIYHTFKLCKACFEVTYSDFFAEGGGFLGAIKQKVTSLHSK